MTTLSKWTSRLLVLGASVLLVLLLLDANAETWIWPASDPSMPPLDPRRDATPGRLWQSEYSSTSSNLLLWLFTVAAATSIALAMLNLVVRDHPLWARGLTFVLLVASVASLPLHLFPLLEEHAYHLTRSIDEAVLVRDIWLTYGFCLAALGIVIALQFLPTRNIQSRDLNR